MKSFYGKLEALILVYVGLATAWLALSQHYGLLMNPKFKWLTLTGAALVLGMGTVASLSGQKRKALNVSVFSLMLLITWIGKPYLPNALSDKMREPQLPAGLWAQVDQARFPRKDLQVLYRENRKAPLLAHQSFTTFGVAKRLPILDEHQSFALMTSMMACCIADAFAVGFRVPSDRWETIEDGQPIMVSGKLAQTETAVTVPNFRFGMAMLSTIDEKCIIQPEKIMSYDRVAQLPSLTDQLDTDRLRLFTQALRQTGLWETLQGDGPFTVFAPVDQAMQNLEEQLLADENRDHLNQLLANHIIGEKLFSRDLMTRDSLRAVTGQTIKVELENGKLQIGQSRLLFKDNEASNGVIHFVYPVIRGQAND